LWPALLDLAAAEHPFNALSAEQDKLILHIEIRVPPACGLIADAAAFGADQRMAIGSVIQRRARVAHIRGIVAVWSRGTGIKKLVRKS
jgi:hypothetical protein